MNPPTYGIRQVEKVRDSRSFADVAKGVSTQAFSRLLELSCIKEVHESAYKSVLVGEVRNFGLLCSFLSLLELEGYDVIKIQYLGGMQVIVKFKSNKAANVFKANRCIWLKWFIWME